MLFASALFLTLLHVVSTTYRYTKWTSEILHERRTHAVCAKFRKVYTDCSSWPWTLGCPDRNPRSGAFALFVSWQSLRHGGRGVHLLRCAVSSLDLFAKSLFVVRRSDLRSLHLQLFCLLEGDSLSHNNLWLSALTTCSLLFSNIF